MQRPKIVATSSFTLRKPQETKIMTLFNLLQSLFSALHQVAPTAASPELKASIARVLDSNLAHLRAQTSQEIDFIQELLRGKTLGPADTRKATKVLSVYNALNTFNRELSRAFVGAGESQLLLPPIANKLKLVPDTDILAKLENEGGFVCRICGETVPLSLVEEHTKLCVAAHESKYQCFLANAKLCALNKELETGFLSVKWPISGEMIYLQVVFEAFYAYTLIDDVVAVKETDREGKEQLQRSMSALSGLKPCDRKVRAVVQEAITTVSQKMQTLNQIEHTASRIAQTTKEKTASLRGLDTRLCDFHFMKQISSGAFARVYLAKRMETDDLVAIKIIKKDQANSKNQLQKVASERDIMMSLHSPFMVRFFYSFIEKRNLYLVMEFLPGGDIYSLLTHLGSLEEQDARTYTVQIVKALEFLRENDIIHRDLKPDNILIDETGRLKLIDFGLSACGLSDRNEADQAMVGTPDYMAPELVRMKPHTFAVDYWSLGTIVYEMLTGVAPFHCGDPNATFGKILTGIYDESELSDFSDECRDFIRRLLESDPKNRLGYNSIEEIERHPWFSGIDWDHILDLKPVFVPECTGDNAAQYFVDRYHFNSDDEEDIKLDVLESKDERQDSYLVPGVGDFTAVSLQHLSESNTEQVQMLKHSTPMTPIEGHKRGKSYAGAGRRVRAQTLTKSLIGNIHRPSLPPM